MFSRLQYLYHTVVSSCFDGVKCDYHTKEICPERWYAQIIHSHLTITEGVRFQGSRCFYYRLVWLLVGGLRFVRGKPEKFPRSEITSVHDYSACISPDRTSAGEEIIRNLYPSTFRAFLLSRNGGESKESSSRFDNIDHIPEELGFSESISYFVLRSTCYSSTTYFEV